MNKYLNSPGHRPMACQILHQPLFRSSVAFFFTSPRARGGPCDPPGQKCTTQRSVAATKSTLWRHMARILFFGLPGRPRKITFFRHRPKCIKMKNKSTLGAPGLHFGPLFITLGNHFGIDFHCFFEWPKVKKSVCFSILFNGFGPSKTIDFPIAFPSIFHLCFKTFPWDCF